MSNPFRYFDSSPEVIRLVVMMYVRYPLSLRNVEDLLAVPWPSGTLSQHRSPLGRWRSRCMSTSLRYFDTANSSTEEEGICRGEPSHQRALAALLASPAR